MSSDEKYLDELLRGIQNSSSDRRNGEGEAPFQEEKVVNDVAEELGGSSAINDANGCLIVIFFILSPI